MPDQRGWVIIALFGLAAYVITLLAIDKALAQVQLFDVVVGAVFTGGISTIVQFLFGSSRSSSDKDAVIAKQLDKAPPP